MRQALGCFLCGFLTFGNPQNATYAFKLAWHSMVNTAIYASSQCYYLLVMPRPCQAVLLRNDSVNGLPVCLS